MTSIYQYLYTKKVSLSNNTSRFQTGQNTCIFFFSFAQWRYHSQWGFTEAWLMVVENLVRQFSFPRGIIKIGEKMWFAAIFEVLIASTSRLFYTDTLWWCENREKLEIRVSVSNIWHVARTKHAFKTHTDTQDSENRENLLGTLSVFPSTPSARDQRLVNKPGREANCMFKPRWRWRCKENLGCFGRFSHPQSTSEQKI